MTWSQWIFEARGLQKKERIQADLSGDIAEASLRAMRQMLIRLLGLDIIPDTRPVAEQEKKPDSALFVPFAFLAGHPEVMQQWVEQAQSSVSTEAATSDMDFDAFSEELLKQLKTGKSALPGDMVPLLTENPTELLRENYWKSQEAQQAIQNLGIRPRVSGDAVPHIGAAPRKLETGFNQEVGPSYDARLIDATDAPDGNLSDEEELAKFRKALGVE